AQQWFSLRMRQDDLNEDKGVRDWLDEVATRTFSCLGASNFGSEMGEFYLDLGVFATAALFCDELPPPYPNVFGGVRFLAVPTNEYVIAENAEQRVDLVIRKFKLPVRELVRLWPGTAGASRTEQAREDRKPDEQIDVLHAVYPRLDTDRRGRPGQ